MMILTVRTDKPEAELGLYEDERQLAYYVWEAHRRLAETIHSRLSELLAEQGKELHDIEAIVVYKGPGSFTGLRIGISATNALAYGLGVPIVGATGAWIEDGIARLMAGESDTVVLPEYGQDPHVTKQKK